MECRVVNALAMTGVHLRMWCRSGRREAGFAGTIQPIKQAMQTAPAPGEPALNSSVRSHALSNFTQQRCGSARSNNEPGVAWPHARDLTTEFSK